MHWNVAEHDDGFGLGGQTSWRKNDHARGERVASSRSFALRLSSAMPPTRPHPGAPGLPACSARRPGAPQRSRRRSPSSPTTTPMILGQLRDAVGPDAAIVTTRRSPTSTERASLTQSEPLVPMTSWAEETAFTRTDRATRSLPQPSRGRSPLTPSCAPTRGRKRFKGTDEALMSRH